MEEAYKWIKKGCGNLDFVSSVYIYIELKKFYFVSSLLL